MVIYKPKQPGGVLPVRVRVGNAQRQKHRNCAEGISLDDFKYGRVQAVIIMSLSTSEPPSGQKRGRRAQAVEPGDGPGGSLANKEVAARYEKFTQRWKPLFGRFRVERLGCHH